MCASLTCSHPGNFCLPAPVSHFAVVDATSANNECSNHFIKFCHIKLAFKMHSMKFVFTQVIRLQELTSLTINICGKCHISVIFSGVENMVPHFQGRSTRVHTYSASFCYVLFPANQCI
jgi:hypothetical protein